MKTNYKGFTIEVNREECLGGWELTYFSIFRDSDGLEVCSDFTEASDSLEFITKLLMSSVDMFIASECENEDLED